MKIRSWSDKWRKNNFFGIVDLYLTRRKSNIFKYFKQTIKELFYNKMFQSQADRVERTGHNNTDD